jgi:predicted dehydrogenase
MWTRYLPHMVRIRELVRDGALGDVRAVIADHTQLISADPAHRLSALHLGGGAVLDLAVYPISFACDMLGAPQSIAAAARLGETGADIEVATTMVHASGALSSTMSAARSAGPNTAHVIGTEARIDIDGVWYKPTTFRLTAPDGTVFEEFAPVRTGRGMQYEAWAAAEIIGSGRTDSDVLPLDESVAIMGALDRVREIVGVRYPGE